MFRMYRSLGVVPCTPSYTRLPSTYHQECPKAPPYVWVQDPSHHMQGCVSSRHLTTRETIHHHQPSSRATKTLRDWRASSRVQFHQGLHQVLAMGFMTNLWVLGTSSMFHKLLHHTEGMYMVPPKASRHHHHTRTPWPQQGLQGHQITNWESKDIPWGHCKTKLASMAISSTVQAC